MGTIRFVRAKLRAIFSDSSAEIAAEGGHVFLGCVLDMCVQIVYGLFEEGWEFRVGGRLGLEGVEILFSPRQTSLRVWVKVEEVKDILPDAERNLLW